LTYDAELFIYQLTEIGVDIAFMLL